MVSRHIRLGSQYRVVAESSRRIRANSIGSVAVLPQRAESRADLAVQMAARHGVVVVLKGHHTLVTDGQRTARNQTGNAGMATGGVGDVLTGVITALLCQGLGGWEAARLGVHIHGLAGDIAAQRYSQVAMTALDVVHCLPDAWRQFQGAEADPR